MPEYTGFKGPLPPVYFLACLLLSIVLHYQAPLAQIVASPWTWAGVVLIIPGLAIVIQPALAFRKAQTDIRPFRESSSLVRTGMYRITRNPMYLGMLAVLLGVSVVCGSLSTFSMPVLFVLIIRYRFIRVEEMMLEEKFGDEYREFKRSVRRWI
jgi:protein-S-isoprenylcysteine O-methyltransferase Ste14